MPLADVRARVTTPEAQDQFKRWFDAAPIYSGSVTDNRFGWQVSRTLAKRAAIAARRVPYRLNDEIAHQLDRDGIVAIPDFLRVDDHRRLATACSDYRASTRVRDIGAENGAGIPFLSGPVASGGPGSPGTVIKDLLGADPRLLRLAQHVIGRRVRPPLRVIYQLLDADAGEVDDRDREQVLHADKAFPCVKAIYAVQDITESTSPFVYCPGTHRLTPDRLRYEHAMGISEARRRRGEFDVAEDIEYQRGRSVMGATLRQRLGVDERPMTCAANTMILTNNAGFHRRGSLTPGAVRETLWINFYPYQRPLYGRLAFRAAKSVLDTDSVSRTLSPRDRVLDA